MRVARWPLALRAPENENGGQGQQQQQQGQGQQNGAQGQNQAQGEQGDGKAVPDKGGDNTLLGLARQQQQGEKKDGQQQANGEEKGKQADAPPKLVFKERPDWLPENFWDAKTGEAKIEDLAKSQRDLRSKVAKGADKTPAKPDGYKFEPPPELAETVKTVIKDAEKDPAIAAFRESAHKHGLSQDQFNGVISDFLAMGEKEGLVVKPMDPMEELKPLGPKAMPMLQHINHIGNTLKSTGVFTEEEAKRFDTWILDRHDVTAFYKLMEFFGHNERPIPREVNTDKGQVSRDSLRTRMADVLKKANAGDRNAAGEYEGLQRDYEKLYGTEPAGTSLRG